MPRHKSAVKRTRQNTRRAERNKTRISKIKTLLKQVRSAKSKDEANIALKRAVKLLDQLSTKGTIHKNTASNQKARLTRFVNKMK